MSILYAGTASGRRSRTSPYGKSDRLLSVLLSKRSRQESVACLYRQPSGYLKKLEEIIIDGDLLSFIPSKEVPRFHPETLSEFLDGAVVRLRMPSREVPVERVTTKTTPLGNLRQRSALSCDKAPES